MEGAADFPRCGRSTGVSFQDHTAPMVSRRNHRGQATRMATLDQGGASNAEKAFGAGISSPSRPRSGEAPGPGVSPAPWPRVHPRSPARLGHTSAPPRTRRRRLGFLTDAGQEALIEGARDGRTCNMSGYAVIIEGVRDAPCARTSVGTSPSARCRSRQGAGPAPGRLAR
jgi:hypothetical protein